MVGSLIYYLVLFALISLALFSRMIKATQEQKQLFFAVTSFLILWMLSAFRYDVADSDYMNNALGTIIMGNTSWKEILASSEFLHSTLQKLCYIIFGEAQSYFFITSFVILICYYCCANKYCENFYVAIILFYTFSYYFSSNNITRQCLAISITLLSWKYVFKGDLKKYLLIMLFAFFVHNITIVFLPMYWLARVRFTKQYLLTYILGTIVLVPLSKRITVFFMNLHLLRFNYNLSSYGMSKSNYLHILPVLVFLFLLIYDISIFNKNVPHYTNQDVEDNFYRHGMALYIACSFVSVTQMLIFSRVALVFIPCAVIGIINIIQKMSPRNHRIVEAVVLISFISMFILENYFGKLSPPYYQTFLGKY